MAGSSTGFLLGVLSTLVAVVAVLWMQSSPAPAVYSEDIYQAANLNPPPWPIWNLVMWMDKFFAVTLPNKMAPPYFRILEIGYGGFQRSALVRTAVKLRLADALWKKGPLAVEDLAKAVDVKAPYLDRFMLAITKLGVFQQLDDGRYANNKVSAFLAQDHPNSVIYFFQYGEMDAFNYWVNLDQLIKSGEVRPLEEWWAEINEDEYKRSTFANFMQSTAPLGNQAVVEDYDFCRYPKVIDMGGGTGGLLKLLLAQCPTTKGVIYELPEIAADAEKKWKTEFSALYPRASFIGGSFLDSAPEIKEGEAYVFRGVLHDWNDEKTSIILKNCREAMAKVPNANSTRLVLVEFFPDQAPGSGITSRMLDIQMMIIGGQERTVVQWDKLLTRHGFKVNKVTQTRSPLTVLEAIPV